MIDTVRVEQLIFQWEELLAQGQYIPPEELCMSCPELLEEVQKRIDEIEPRTSEKTPYRKSAEWRRSLSPKVRGILTPGHSSFSRRIRN